MTCNNCKTGLKIRFLIFTVLVYFSPFAPFAQDSDLPVYSAELFYPIENSPDFYSAPDFGDGGERNKAAEEGKKELFKEAQFLFSGMVYGFEFKYIPGDIRRSVDEVFEIVPIGTINWGDPRLKIRGARAEGNRNLIQFSYYPAESMRSWIMYWSSGAFPVTGGKADGSFLKGFAAKRDALEKGVKEAVRNYMRSRVHNKPQRIEGEFAFAAPPVYSYAGGIYTASVKVKLNIRKVSSYDVY